MRTNEQRRRTAFSTRLRSRLSEFAEVDHPTDRANEVPELLADIWKEIEKLQIADVIEGDYVRAARIAHEVNRAYCQATGDDSQLPWDEAPAWQRASALMGVEKIDRHEITEPGESHASWMEQKLADGWTYGPEKDPDAKTHPCLVPFDELPLEQRVKDHLFIAVVKVVLR